MENVRCRVAPSPSGNLHVGTAHTALFNYLFSKHHNGAFILRIDDSDATRSSKEYEQNIIESLKWLGIHWEEGADIGGPYEPYRQSQRLSSYAKYITQLLNAGKAYYCYCTSEELKAERDRQSANKEAPKYSGRCANISNEMRASFQKDGRRPAVRFRTPNSVIKIHDLVRGDIEVNAGLFGDFVIARSDGSALLNIAATVDDIEMHISHAIRGEDFLNMTPRQILLTEALGHEPPKFAHLSFLYAPDRTKLSKRHGATSITEYKDMGILPEAMVNYLATLGWSFPGKQGENRSDTIDIFSLRDAIQVFDISKVQKSAPIFDFEKLRWMNGEYIRMKSDEELATLIHQHLSSKVVNKNAAADELTTSQIIKVLPLVKERMKTLGEFWPLAGFFFEKPTEYEQPLKDDHIQAAKSALSGCAWDHDAMEKTIRTAADSTGLKAREVFMQLRVAVTGKTVGPPLLESLEILGKEETLSRL